MSKTNKDLKTGMIDIGFSEKEANVYLALLELGKGTVSATARAAGINRTTGYNVLDSLVSKGLIRVSGKEPKQEYVTESPTLIISLLKERAKKSQEQLKNATKIVPQLKSIHNVGNRPKVKFYEGEAGLIDVYEDTLTAKETIRAYATVDVVHNTLPDYFPKYYKRRASKKIAIRAIIPKTEASIERIKHDKAELRTTCLIPSDEFYFSPEINIYDNKVMIASWREKLGIIIESEEIADAMKKIYELSWEEAKRLDKKLKTNRKTPKMV
ncbi:MAG: hypothetical protein HQ539_00725 [Parcubacteria group bacterium]|nr:hypothetical protein [Parcubacteria group bacterium]